jgi:hypothetical protein
MIIVLAKIRENGFMEMTDMDDSMQRYIDRAFSFYQSKGD